MTYIGLYWCFQMSYSELACTVMAYHIMSYNVMSCLVKWSDVLSYNMKWCHFLWEMRNPSMSWLVVSYIFMPCLVMSCVLMSWHVIFLSSNILWCYVRCYYVMCSDVLRLSGATWRKWSLDKTYEIKSVVCQTCHIVSLSFVEYMLLR